MSTNNYYQIGGSLTSNANTYVIRKADQQLFQLLTAGEYCFILNSRQMGKSSLRVKTGKKLRSQGVKCAFIDMTLIGTHVTKEQWYKGIAYQILDGLELDTELDFMAWWKQHEYLTEIQRLKHLIESVIFVNLSPNIVIFLDEIDSIIKIPFKDDFFAFIRGCYNLRAENLEYKRLSFCLLGVSTPADLIPDKKRTPFNIGCSIELTGFTFAEAKDVLIGGLQGKVNHPENILQQVLYWTGGQPFLTQKVCSLIVQCSENNPDIQQLIKQYIINNWESQDEPEHLKTIRDRILADESKAIRLLGLYQQILLSADLTADESDEQTELRLSGLVVKKNGFLQVYNPIYKAIFNPNWVKSKLDYLRPYSTALNQWLKSQRHSTYLLQGNTLTDALAWADGKRLSDEDYQFLGASQTEQDRKTHQILAQAYQKAKRISLLGGIVFSISITIVIVVSIYTHNQLQTTQETIQASENALKKFNSNQIDGLRSAMQASINFKSLIKNNSSLADYPTTSPVYALVNILSNISEKNQLEGHQKSVRTVSFSPDGRLIASGSDDRTIKLWKRDGRLIKTINQGSLVNTITFRSDGQIIASGDQDGNLKLWRLDGTLVKVIKHTNNGSVSSVSFSPDGKIIVSGSNDNTIKLWNLNGTLIKTLIGHKDSVRTVNFSPNGKIIASGSDDRTIKLWNLDGTLIKTINGGKSRVYAVSFSPNGNYIASGSDDKKIKLWKLNGTLIQTMTGHSETVNSVAFSPDDKIIASGSDDKTIKLWKLNGDLITTLNGHTNPISALSFSPDGKAIASGSLDNTIKLWQLEPKPIIQFKGHDRWISSVSFSPDGKIIASGSGDNTIKLWQPNGTLVKRINNGNGNNLITNVSFSPDGKILAFIDSNGTVKLWQDGKIIKTIIDPKSEINSISFSPDSKTFISGSSDYTVKLWKIDGTLLKTIARHNSEITSVNFSPDGTNFASGSQNGTIKLWKTDGTLVKTLTEHTKTVTQISYSPDGKILASSSNDRTVKLWKNDGTLIKSLSEYNSDVTNDGTLIKSLPEHNSDVTSVIFSPDSKMLASSNGNGKVNLWKNDGTFMFTFTAGDRVTSISFSPDGKTLVAASKDSLILWSLNLDDLLTKSCTWLKDYLALTRSKVNVIDLNCKSSLIQGDRIM